MPAIIDHDKRRRDVADIAATLIAQSGIEALTIRGVARVAGFSTAIVSHYFKSKRELLLFIYQHVGDRGRVSRRPPGPLTSESLCLMIEDSLIGGRSRENWRVWFAFWGIAASDQEFAREQWNQMRKSRALIEERLRIGLGISDDEAKRVARLFLTMMMGLAMEICFDAENGLSDEEVRPLVSEAIAVLFPTLAKPRLIPTLDDTHSPCYRAGRA